MSLVAKRAGQIVDGELKKCRVQDLPCGREMRDVVPTIASLQDYKSITAAWRPKGYQPVIHNVT
jgi:hypothetical protein